MKTGFILPIKKISELDEEFDKILYEHRNEIIKFTTSELEHSKKHVMLTFEF